MKPKVVIHVSGGLVQSVSADCELNVKVVDVDNLKAEGRSSSEIDKIYKEETKDLKEIY